MINFKKYRICRRYSPNIGIWYVIQKRTLFFWWHTLNISFYDLYMTNQYLKVLYQKKKDDFWEFCETPLIWSDIKEGYEEIYPCKTYNKKIK